MPTDLSDVDAIGYWADGWLRTAAAFGGNSERASWMSLRRNTRARRRFEGLENRLLMAGDVTVELLGQTLYVTGDNEANHVEIAGDNAGNLVVTGLDGETLTGTTSVPASGVRSLVVRLNRRADSVSIQNANIPYAITIVGGPGHNDISIGTAADPVTVGNDLTIVTGGGDDTIDISDVEVGRNLVLASGYGDDDVRIQDSSIDGALVANLGNGANDLELESLDIVRGLAVAAGTGVDSIELSDVAVTFDAAISTGFGNDTVTLNGLETRRLSVATARGADVVTLNNVTADAFFAELGRGNDRLEGFGSISLARAMMDGGQGTDTFLGIALSSTVRNVRFEL